RRHTRFSRDWSSDVCSSDLSAFEFGSAPHAPMKHASQAPAIDTFKFLITTNLTLSRCHARRCRGVESGRVSARGWRWKRELATRSEERRGGKECRWRWGQRG